MLKYIIINFLRGMFLLVVISITSFILVISSPVDPVQSYIGSGVVVSHKQREEISMYLEIDKPYSERFENWARDILNFDMGISFIYRRPVIDVINDKLGLSLLLIFISWLFAGIFGFIFGVFMGSFENTIFDKILKSLFIVFSSIPTIWIGILLIMVFSVYLGLFPIGFSVPIGVEKDNVTFIQKLHHMILPSITLGISYLPSIALHTRAKAIEIINSEYVLFSKARGENIFNIIKKHCIKNSFIPALTFQFASIGEMISNTIIIEQIFSYPGIGQAVVDAGIRQDIPLVLGITVIIATIIFISNFLVNIIYIFVNPKMKLEVTKYE